MPVVIYPASSPVAPDLGSELVRSHEFGDFLLLFCGPSAGPYGARCWSRCGPIMPPTHPADRRRGIALSTVRFQAHRYRLNTVSESCRVRYSSIDPHSAAPGVSGGRRQRLSGLPIGAAGLIGLERLLRLFVGDSWLVHAVALVWSLTPPAFLGPPAPDLVSSIPLLLLLLYLSEGPQATRC